MLNVKGERFSRGFDAGNYANANESDDWIEAWSKVELKDSQDENFRQGYLMGFFSSYEIHEVPGEYRDDVINVRAEVLIVDVAAKLKDVRDWCRKEGFDTCDVRLQYHDDDDWAVRFGDAQYDSDHRGYWGAGCISKSYSSRTLEETARDIVGQALEQRAMGGED